MPNLVAVGGAPSSGTTLLADLLDSIPGSVCPPELYILCFDKVYQFDASFKASALTDQRLQSGACYARNQQFFNRKYLPLLNLELRDVADWLDASDNIGGFINRLADHMARQRDREIQVFCEKTPINVNQAELFCRHLPDGLFIHVVRSGPEVVGSLTRRGFRFHEAALVWMAQVVAGRKARSYDNYLEVRFDDLVNAPFDTACGIAKRLGLTVTPDEIAERFAQNTFRSTLPRPASWTARTYTGAVETPSPPELDAAQRAFLGTAALHVIEEGEGHCVTSFNELQDILGYSKIDFNPDDIDNFQEDYLRYSKNLGEQSGFVIVNNGSLLQAANQRALASQAEIVRLRSKIKKMNLPAKEEATGSSYRVLLGPLGSAGQPGMLARALRADGIAATSFLVGGNKFGYETDDWTPERSNQSMKAVLARKLPDTDILHIHAITPLFVKRALAFPMGTDLLAAKAAGKRVIMHFRGSEVRDPDVFKQHSPFHYVDEDPNGLVSGFPAIWQRQYIQLCRALADRLVVTDPELQTYVPDAEIVQRAIDIDMWKPVGLVNESRPLIVHAPSRQAVKGTPHVLEAIEVLRGEGLDFDFRLVEGLSNLEARRVYEEADIVVDQLRIGWYGVLAVEAMALGKAVVSYVRDDLLHHLGDPAPIMVADPTTIADRLRDLIQNLELRRAIAARGRQFCEDYHAAPVVAQRCRKLYDDVWRQPSTIDLTSYFDINDHQESLAESMSKANPAFAKELAAQTRQLQSQIASLKTRNAYLADKSAKLSEQLLQKRAVIDEYKKDPRFFTGARPVFNFNSLKRITKRAMRSINLLT